MIDQFTETTSTSWFSRIAGSISGILVGVLFFVMAFPLIWWNEGRSVERIKTLNEAKKSVITVSATALNPANNDRLIHISEQATTNEILKDAIFGVEENALKVQRKVEMFQWQENTSSEKKKKIGGGETTQTTYSYEKIWSENLINSSSFKQASEYQNPTDMPFKSQTVSSANVTVGAYKLSDRFINKLSHYTPYALSEENFNVAEKSIRSDFKLHDGQYFKGDTANPEIGAMRVSYSLVKPHMVSVMGKQNGEMIDTYVTKNGTIELLKAGSLSSDAMIKVAESENKLLTWIIRVIAFIVMWAGLAMVLRPIQILADVLPFLGSLVGVGVGLITGIIAFTLSFATMALAWVFFRPVMGIALLVAAGLGIFAAFRLMSQKGGVRQPKAVAAPQTEGEGKKGKRSLLSRLPTRGEKAPTGPQPYNPQAITPRAQAQTQTHTPPQPAQQHAYASEAHPHNPQHPAHGQAHPGTYPYPQQGFAPQAPAPAMPQYAPQAPALAPTPQHAAQPQGHVPQQYVPPSQVQQVPQMPQTQPAQNPNLAGYPPQAYAPQAQQPPQAQSAQPTEFVPQPFIPPTPSSA